MVTFLANARRMAEKAPPILPQALGLVRLFPVALPEVAETFRKVLLGHDVHRGREPLAPMVWPYLHIVAVAEIEIIPKIRFGALRSLSQDSGIQISKTDCQTLEFVSLCAYPLEQPSPVPFTGFRPRGPLSNAKGRIFRAHLTSSIRLDGRSFKSESFVAPRLSSPVSRFPSRVLGRRGQTPSLCRGGPPWSPASKASTGAALARQGPAFRPMRASAAPEANPEGRARRPSPTEPAPSDASSGRTIDPRLPSPVSRFTFYVSRLPSLVLTPNTRLCWPRLASGRGRLGRRGLGGGGR